MKLLAAVQPSYLAWIPYFLRMYIADIFVYLDDVEYSKNSFHNRNRIKTSNGPLLLTVPVNYKGNSKALIKDMTISNIGDWSKKHSKSIEMSYSRALYFKPVMEILDPLYKTDWKFLADLNIAIIETFKKFFSISTRTLRSSEMEVKDFEGDKKLVEICRLVQASHFLVKPGTESYHPPDHFTPHGISLTTFEPKEIPYPQRGEDYISGLSILDLAMNLGPEGFCKLYKDLRL